MFAIGTQSLDISFRAVREREKKLLKWHFRLADFSKSFFKKLENI